MGYGSTVLCSHPLVEVLFFLPLQALLRFAQSVSGISSRGTTLLVLPCAAVSSRAPFAPQWTLLPGPCSLALLPGSAPWFCSFAPCSLACEPSPCSLDPGVCCVGSAPWTLLPNPAPVRVFFNNVFLTRFLQQGIFCCGLRASLVPAPWGPGSAAWALLLGPCSLFLLPCECF